jgi:hypothetical protein
MGISDVGLAKISLKDHLERTKAQMNLIRKVSLHHVEGNTSDEFIGTVDPCMIVLKL